MDEEDYVMVIRDEQSVPIDHLPVPHDFLSEIDSFVDELHTPLWPLNKSIHENPELAFEEHKTHDALTNFMVSQEGWKVTKSAYGMETAWVASYDGVSKGRTVSFNAEMGMSLCSTPRMKL